MNSFSLSVALVLIWLFSLPALAKDMREVFSGAFKLTLQDCSKVGQNLSRETGLTHSQEGWVYTNEKARIECIKPVSSAAESKESVNTIMCKRYGNDGTINTEFDTMWVNNLNATAAYGKKGNVVFVISCKAAERKCTTTEMVPDASKETFFVTTTCNGKFYGKCRFCRAGEMS